MGPARYYFVVGVEAVVFWLDLGDWNTESEKSVHQWSLERLEPVYALDIDLETATT